MTKLSVFFRNFTIAGKLNAVIVIVVAIVVILGAAGLLLCVWLGNQLEARSVAELQRANRQVVDMIDVYASALERSAEILGRQFAAGLPKRLALDGARTLQTAEGDFPMLRGDGKTLNNNLALVDAFTAATGGVATVFVRKGDDFFRVATSLKKQDGKRALGTPLGAKHPAFALVMDGKSYTGRANLFGREYMTRYIPLNDEAGQVIGIAFVGMDFSEGMQALKKKILDIKVGETGYVFALDAAKEAGMAMIHPASEGKNIGGAKDDSGRLFIKEMLDMKRGVIRYDWINKELGETVAREKIVVADTYEKWGWLIGTGSYLDEIMRDVRVLQIQFAIACLVVAAALMGVVFFSRQKIHQMVFYDSLTSLPNRALFNDRLHQMLTDSSWHGQQAGVMLLDLDRFKAVNDTLGHPAGDELLCEAAERLKKCARAYDTVARLGGDEFAILLPEIRTGDDLGKIASKILEAIKEPFQLEGKEVFISTSIGIAVYPDDSDDAHELLKQSDSAMYSAKRSGRNAFRFYSKDLTSSAKEKLTLESDLQHGFKRGELELYYQPKISLVDGSLLGSEALLRWRHPTCGMVAPDKFISIAEDSGLIVEIGAWVLRDACRTASGWNGSGKPLHKVAINLSARQFQADNLLQTVRDALSETNCRAEWIELEITESLLLDEDGVALDMLEALRAMGITIAIDDFGTGYSSLSYLARFPIDTLKIDRSFTSKVAGSQHHAELVKAMIAIAHSLNQQVVAEGVDTEEEAAFLREHGCHIAQGYLYGKPVPKTEFCLFPFALGKLERRLQ